MAKSWPCSMLRLSSGGLGAACRVALDLLMDRWMVIAHVPVWCIRCIMNYMTLYSLISTVFYITGPDGVHDLTPANLNTRLLKLSIDTVMEKKLVPVRLLAALKPCSLKTVSSR